MSTGDPPPFPSTSPGSSTSTLRADSTYDDQGLFFSLILCGVLLAVYVPLVMCFVGTSKLWLKRFYRPNHTIEPPPRTKSAPTVGQSHASKGVHTNANESSANDSSSHTSGSAAAATSVGQRGRRCGISLPYRSTMFHLPSWQDWVSVEERVPHLESALSSSHATLAAPTRFSGTRSFASLSPTTRGPVELEAPTPTTPLSPMLDTVGNPQCVPRRHYGSVECRNTSNPSTLAAATPAAASSPSENLPKTPLDPQVALYIFTLKFFAALMVLGGCFTVWISVVASQDDYNAYTMVKLDTKRCHRQDANESGCLLKRPYCQYLGEELGCSPVALPGLYDLTTKNLTPGSWRWWPVVLLNCGFCLVMVLLTVFYISRVNSYVRDVMRYQMKHALGYRVACVRGIAEEEMKSVPVFTSSFLQERSYFLPRTGERRDGGGGNGPQRREMGRENGGAPPSPSPSSARPPRDSSSENEFDYYEQLDCNGLDCLFGIVGCHYYTIHRSDATFTRPGKVKQLLFTRKPPKGMYRAIGAAEHAMAEMEDIIAEEKAVRRKQRHQRQRQQQQQRGGGASTSTSPPAPDSTQRVWRDGSSATTVRFPLGGSPSSDWSSVESAALAPTAEGASPSLSRTNEEQTHQAAADDDDEGPLLYTRGGEWPNCCGEVPALPFYEKRLRSAGAKLNEMIVQVPQQPADSATFVIFADARAAFEFISLFNARYGGWLSSAVACIAGPPGEVISNNVLTDKVVLGVRYFLCFVVFVILVFSYSIPIGMLGSLENLSYMPGVGQSFSEYYVATVPAWLRNIINAYLPVLALSLFYVVLPAILRVMVLIMGAFNKAECDAGQLYLQYIFMVLTAVIFQAALQGGFAQLAFLVSAGESKLITEFFVSCVTPANANYFYAKVLMALSFSAWNDLVDPVGIIEVFLLRAHVHVQRNYDALFMPCEMEFPKRYSTDLMILAIGLLFHMTMPILGLFVGVYFIVRYITQRAKLYDRYRPTVSPSQDCTDFTVCAQVLRCVMWLYILAETGGVLLLSLRKHTGGVLVCSLTLATSMILLIYVHLQTRKWMSTLGRVREFSREVEFAEVQRQLQQQQQRERASGGAGSMPGAFPPPSPSVPDDASSVGPDWEASRPQASDERADMDSYENLRFRLSDDSHNNPFMGYLLPRVPDVSCRYQPKHQRLAPLDVDAELEKMKSTVFVVERYWDTGKRSNGLSDDVVMEPTTTDQSHSHNYGSNGNIYPQTRHPKRVKRMKAGSVVVETDSEAAAAAAASYHNAPHQSMPQAATSASSEARYTAHRYSDLDREESDALPLSQLRQYRPQLEDEVLRDSMIVPPQPVSEPPAEEKEEM